MSVRGKETGNRSESDSYMRKPDERSSKQKCLEWLYNPSEGTVLGKTAKQWGVTGLFYSAFYAGLALFCAICFWVLMSTIDEHRPTFTLDSSIIGTNPGLGFRPISEDTTQGSLIWYKANDPKDVERWTKLLDEFLNGYVNRSNLIDGGKNQMQCSHDRQPVNGKVCSVDLNNYGDCSPAMGYGYNNSKPCVFIKLNRIFDWVPEYYNTTENLPKDMPDDLKEHIRYLAESNQKDKLNNVWVSCVGEGPRAKETIGQMRYYPESRGFPGYYYPYTKQREYASPVVAVQFTNATLHEIIKVECRAWAKNIIYSSQRGEKSGAVHFEIMID